MSGFIFGGPLCAYSNVFKNYYVFLQREETTTYITLLTYDWFWAEYIYT